MKMRAMITGCIAGLLAACGPIEAGDDGGSVVCGAVRVYDTDGDGISDRVEENNASNGYADLANGRCDDDPTEAVGSPGNGSLRNGLNLPDRNTGYQHFYGTDPVDFDDWGVLSLLTCVEAAGRALASRNIPVQIGDMSKRNGGTFPPHQGHQNGIEGDFRYVRTDRAMVPLNLAIEPAAYDPDATQAVFEALFDVCDIDFILVDRDELGFTIPGRDAQIIDSPGHSNHFHIRIRGD